ncbi:reverse transcriptase [Gossypium australe]|uniref:Reverse transcriptase n=1 Tax=Gossypium australe TaxID=47621 RepID=A0A5B6VPJ4_9ROSI|nr:reverse transcriptase [Gossypium australe]
MLLKMGFASSWVYFIMHCINFVSYSIVINGCKGEKIKPTRRLRQGDPLSLEGLSTVMCLAKRDGMVKGATVSRKGPKISYYILRMTIYCLGRLQIHRAGKKLVFQGLKDRMSKKITNWSTKFLLQGGKEIFIKFVLEVIPTYSMAYFLLPKSLCFEMKEHLHIILVAKEPWKAGDSLVCLEIAI